MKERWVKEFPRESRKDAVTQRLRLCWLQPINLQEIIHSFLYVRRYNAVNYQAMDSYCVKALRCLSKLLSWVLGFCSNYNIV